MSLERLPNWSAVGARVAETRRMLRLTQTELGDQLGLGRTTIAKIESGNRALSALELAALARVTALPIDWFVSESPPVVASRRAEDTREPSAVDVRIEALAREVMQLLELGLLRPTNAKITLPVPRGVAEAEQAATKIREQIGHDAEELVDLSAVAERLDLFSYSLEFPDSQTDGAYVAISDEAGVALVNGTYPSARRRFTLAHEIGHHVFQDAYAVDLDLTASPERLINAFAIHLLLPREALQRRWRELQGKDDSRRAAIILGAERRVSWTALCGQLVNVGLIDRRSGDNLREVPPRRAEYLELGVSIAEELVPPAIPRPIVQAVLRGYRRHRLGTGRTLELLHGAVSEDDLPEQDVLPREALAGELRGG